MKILKHTYANLEELNQDILSYFFYKIAFQMKEPENSSLPG